MNCLKKVILVSLKQFKNMWPKEMHWFTVEQSICYYEKIRTGKINLIP